MSKLSQDAVLDLATEIRRGQKKLADVDPKVAPRVSAALRSPITMQQHARRREREINPLPSRFQASRPERCRFV